MNFCRRCGTALTRVGDNAYRCVNNHEIFLNSAPTVGIFLIANDGEVLLSRRGIQPGKGLLDAFGGFVDGSESLEDATKRELQEELSLERHEYGDLHFIASYEATYLFGGEHLPIASCVFWADLLTDRRLMPSEDVAEIVKLPITSIDESQLHNDDIVRAVQALKALHAEGKLQ